MSDGISGPDVDQQSYLDILLGHYKAVEPDTDFISYEVAFGSTANAADGPASMYIDWEPWHGATIAGALRRVLAMALQPGSKVYVHVRATNSLGQLSPVMSSDGVKVGKSEITLNKAEAATMSMDTVPSVPVDGDDNATVVEEDEFPTTVVTAAIPAGAVSEDGTTFVGGTVDSADLEDGSAVDAAVTPPPKPNFKVCCKGIVIGFALNVLSPPCVRPQFGNYSFKFEAYDSDGNKREGYKFDKPVIFTMYECHEAGVGSHKARSC